MASEKKLLGDLAFVSRTFEGRFMENPYVLDMDANLYIGPADQYSRDEHSAIEVVFHFLRETGRINMPLRDLAKNRCEMLDAFGAFDDARSESKGEEFRIFVFSTYDGEPLKVGADDVLPAGPCGKPINEIKMRFYKLCRKMDKEFSTRQLTPEQQQVESRFVDNAG